MYCIFVLLLVGAQQAAGWSPYTTAAYRLAAGGAHMYHGGVLEVGLRRGKLQAGLSLSYLSRDGYESVEQYGEQVVYPGSPSLFGASTTWYMRLVPVRDTSLAKVFRVLIGAEVGLFLERSVECVRGMGVVEAECIYPGGPSLRLYAGHGRVRGVVDILALALFHAQENLGRAPHFLIRGGVELDIHSP